MKYSLIFLFLVILVVTACNKTKYINIDPNLKNAFFYKIGTYWVYTDSLSSDIDSFFVTNSSDAHDMTTDNQNEEHINIDISEYIKHATGLVDTSAWTLLIARNYLAFTWLKALSTTIYIDYSYIYYPFEVGPLNQYTTTAGTIDSVGTSCVVNKNIFSSVAMISYHDSTLVFNDILYLNAANGLVKIKLSHPKLNINKIWELQRWHIVK
ncbi:MAG: hypothetical protein ACTHJ0_05075 [Flavipsychrobacter sp.]